MKKIFNSIFCIHNWSVWSSPIDTFDSGHKQQWRECVICKKAKFRTLRWDKQCNISRIEQALQEIRNINT